jgi:hypothetical protein
MTMWCLDERLLLFSLSKTLWRNRQNAKNLKIVSIVLIIYVYQGSQTYLSSFLPPFMHIFIQLLTERSISHSHIPRGPPLACIEPRDWT